MISPRLTGRLAPAVFTALHYFLSLWERTEVRVNLSWPSRPSPFPLPKGEGGICINSLGAMSQFRFHAQTVRVDNSRNVKLYESPSRAEGLPTIN